MLRIFPNQEMGRTKSWLSSEEILSQIFDFQNVQGKKKVDLGLFVNWM